MIPVTTIISRIESALDAEGFDHYNFSDDYKPAINYAQDWLTQLYSRVLGSKKYSEEMLRDLSYIKVWKTSIYGRINFATADIGGELWSILGVYPEAEVVGTELDPTGTGPPADAYSYITEYIYIKSDFAAKRGTAETINGNRNNPFAKGNEIVTGDLRTYAYTTMIDMNTLTSELSVIPSTGARQTVAVAYLLTPTAITATTDDVLFPDTLLSIIVDKALSWISWKQGDGTRLQAVTEADIQQLITLTT